MLLKIVLIYLLIGVLLRCCLGGRKRSVIFTAIAILTWPALILAFIETLAE